MNLLEPAVALTDLGLTVENAVFVGLLARLPTSEATARRWWMLFFAGLALAALLGFVSHGLFADKLLPLHQWIWSGSLLSIGVIALAATAVAADLRSIRGWRARWCGSSCSCWCSISLSWSQVTVPSDWPSPRTHRLPCSCWSHSCIDLARIPLVIGVLGIGGLALTAVAATIQQLGIGLHPVHFNHNALYHVIQALALWMLYVTARASLRARVRE